MLSLRTWPFLGQSRKVSSNVPVSHGRTMDEDEEGRLLGALSFTSPWPTSDKLLNIVCSCFLIYETEVSIYPRGLLAV